MQIEVIAEQVPGRSEASTTGGHSPHRDHRRQRCFRRPAAFVAGLD